MTLFFAVWKFGITNSLRCLYTVEFSLLDEEKKMVEEVFSNAIDCLSDEDKKLPQVCLMSLSRVWILTDSIYSLCSSWFCYCVTYCTVCTLQ